MGRVALIGAGRMGLPVVGSLVRAGHDVRVHDRRASVADAVVAVGARWVDTPSAVVAEPEVVLTVLPGSPELRALMLDGPDGLLARLPAGTTWIDLTSASPALGAELAEAARAREVDFLDAPMGGGPGAAADGTLTLHVGGPEPLLAAHRALLESFAAPDRIHHCGGPGTGYLTKLLVNLLWFGQAVAVGEALLLGQRAGVAPARLAEVLGSGPAASAFVSDYVPALLAGDRLPAFGLDRVVEELESVRALAAGLGTPFAVSGTVARTYREALAHFGPLDGELLGVAYLESLAGRRLGDNI